MESVHGALPCIARQSPHTIMALYKFFFFSLLSIIGYDIFQACKLNKSWFRIVRYSSTFSPTDPQRGKDNLASEAKDSYASKTFIIYARYNDHISNDRRKHENVFFSKEAVHMEAAPRRWPWKSWIAKDDRLKSGGCISARHQLYYWLG